MHRKKQAKQSTRERGSLEQVAGRHTVDKHRRALPSRRLLFVGELHDRQKAQLHSELTEWMDSRKKATLETVLTKYGLDLRDDPNPGVYAVKVGPPAAEEAAPTGLPLPDVRFFPELPHQACAPVDNDNDSDRAQSENDSSSARQTSERLLEVLQGLSHWSISLSLRAGPDKKAFERFLTKAWQSAKKQPK